MVVVVVVVVNLGLMSVFIERAVRHKIVRQGIALIEPVGDLRDGTDFHAQQLHGCQSRRRDLWVAAPHPGPLSATPSRSCLQ